LKYFLMRSWRRILRPVVDGILLVVACIMLLVLVVTSLVAGLIYVLLTTRILSRPLCRMLGLTMRGTGTQVDQDSVCSREGSIVLVMTRWAEKDLTGQLVRQMARDPKADQWEVVEFPMELPSGDPVWPEYWSLDDLTAVKASIPPGKWNAQYQQLPTGDTNAILKREWWQIWEKDKVPKLEYVIQSYDTAFSKKETADYSAITTWGVFYPDEGTQPNLILLDSKKGRWDFPELKRIAYEEYKFWDPETVIIEAKATGLPLTHELRNMGIPVVNFTPSRGNDKVSRVNSISPLLESGMVWAPDTQWAHELIEECAAFPNGEHDDLVDSTTQALMRYRQGNFVQLPSDDWEDEDHDSRTFRYYG
jgi:predicted phage terminase large subunit-like protein